jgi:hypothetical protein
MPATFTEIQTIRLTSNQNSFTFSSIPASYTDLYLYVATRSTQNQYYAGENFVINGTNWQTGNTVSQAAQQDAGGFSGYANTSMNLYMPGATATANLFSANGYYFSNYTNSLTKAAAIQYSIASNSGTGYFTNLEAVRNSSTSVISSISVTHSGGNNFVAGSVFALYGIKSS